MALTVTWLGQSGLLLAGDGRIVLIDPWLSPHPERATPPPQLEWPNRIDLLLITHGHGDHLDLDGLKGLAKHIQIAEIAAPIPHLAAIEAALPAIPRVGVRPHFTLDRLGGIAVLPAWHGVTAADGYGPMIGADGASPHVGYFFTLGGMRIYVSGDTLADDALLGMVRPWQPQLMFLPVNGHDSSREARGILGNMSAAEALEFAIAAGASTLVPLHHDGVTGNTADIGEIARAAQGRPMHLLLPARSIPFVLDGTLP